jgi:serine/threonine protein kinase
LNTRAHALNANGSLSVVNRQGEVVNSSVREKDLGLNVSNQNYFKAFTGASDPGLFIDLPQHHQATGLWTLTMARRIGGQDDAFRGVIAVELQIVNLEQLFSHVKLEYDRPASIYMVDGTLVASSPHRETLLGSLAPELSREPLPQLGGEIKMIQHSSGDGMVLPWLPIRLSELTPLPAHELIAIFELLAQTVVGLNWSGVAHRDITPDNILFVDTSARQPWLADFGMAVHIGSPIHVAPAIRCTKGYAWLDSPSPTDPRQDSFALAVSMWFALTGALPPTKPTSASLRKLARQRGVSVPRAWISRFARWLTHPPQPQSLLAEVRHMHVLFINGSRPNQLRSILTSVVFWTAIASVLAVAAYTFWAIS